MHGNTKKAFLSVALVAVFVFIFFSPAIAANGNQPPVVDFSWTPTDNIKTGDTVQFNSGASNDPDGTIIAWEWDFGDGNYSILENPTHVYTENDTFTVELTVIDNNGSTNSTTKQITIQNRAPTADAGPNQLVNTTLVSFDGTGSSDPDGSIDSYAWDFGDNTTGTGATPTHTYSQDGSYTVTLNVTDDDGGTDEDTASVTVDTQPPETTATLNGTEGDHDWYTSNVTVTLEANDTTVGVQAIYYKINDGNWTLYQAPFTVSAEGENTVWYYALDDAGNKEATKNVTIKIDKEGPSVTITSPQEGYIYLFGRRLIPTIRGNTYAFGRITIEATVTASPADVDKVRFLVDGETRYTVFEEPYTWRWGMALGGHNIEVKAYDMTGRSATAERYISIISLLPGQSSTTADDAVDAS
jgi:PKD repeat protein